MEPCQKNPLCNRGFNHGGKGGHCSLGARRPSKSAASVIANTTPADSPAARAAPERAAAAARYSELLDDDNLPSWMLEEELFAAKVDFKLWDGAAAEGWRVLPKYKGGGARNNWLYLAPSGAQMRNRAAAIAAAIDGGSAAAAAAKASGGGSAAERGSRASGSRASSADPRRPSGCLRKRPRATQSAAAGGDYSKEFGAALVETARAELYTELWQPTLPPAPITAAETAQRMKATVPRDSLAMAAHPHHRCRSEASCSTAAPANSAAAAAAAAIPKLGGIRHVLEQVARSGTASLRARNTAVAVLASVDSATHPLPAPHLVPAHDIAACSTLAPKEGVECADAGLADGECGRQGCMKRSGHKGICDVPDVDRSSRARRMPKWRLEQEVAAGDEGGGEVLASQQSPDSVGCPPTTMSTTHSAGAGP